MPLLALFLLTYSVRRVCSKSAQIQRRKHASPKNYLMSRYLISKNTRRAAFILLTCFWSIQPGFADKLDFSSGDTVTVTAQRAWEGDEANVVHFSGKFELRAPDWSLVGDTAVVYGKLDNPDRVVVEGNPARISFLRDDQGDASSSDPQERVDGTALVVEYFRASDKLKMRGAASLVRKDITLVSEAIEYDVDTDRYSASGEGGINIQFSNDDD
jgi:lipopolysaccharide transport protein LptA